MGSGSSTCKANSIAQDLRGKHFVVTGANTGLGYITSRELAKMGAKVTLACRSSTRAQEAVDKLRQEALAKPVKEVREPHGMIRWCLQSMGVVHGVPVLALPS